MQTKKLLTQQVGEWYSEKLDYIKTMSESYNVDFLYSLWSFIGSIVGGGLLFALLPLYVVVGGLEMFLRFILLPILLFPFRWFWNSLSSRQEPKTF